MPDETVLQDSRLDRGELEGQGGQEERKKRQRRNAGKDKNAKYSSSFTPLILVEWRRPLPLPRGSPQQRSTQRNSIRKKSLRTIENFNDFVGKVIVIFTSKKKELGFFIHS